MLFDLSDYNVRCVHCFMLQAILKSVLRDKLELLPLAIFHGMLYFLRGLVTSINIIDGPACTHG